MEYGYVDSFYVSSEFPHGENYKKIYPMQSANHSWRDLAKIFWKYFKTNDSIGVTRQQTWLRNEEIAEYFGENLDILTDLNMDFQ